MKNINISDLISSLGKSVDDAIEDLKRSKVSCDLEEFELTATFKAELDTLETGIDPKTKNIKGLSFFETRKNLLANSAITNKVKTIADKNMIQEEENTGSITVRIVFSPKTE
jgi:hypothetical protein